MCFATCVMLGFRSGLIERTKFRAGWFVSGVVLAGLLSAQLAEQTLIYPILQDNLNYLRLSSMQAGKLPDPVRIVSTIREQHRLRR